MKQAAELPKFGNFGKIKKAWEKTHQYPWVVISRDLSNQLFQKGVLVAQVKLCALD